MSTTPNYGWPTPDDTDLVKDGAAAIRALGDAADATVSAVTIPVGGIILWSGAIGDVPDGWQLCDGSNGTPNLRDRFVVGAGTSYAVGATGGADSVALSEANLPAHTHGRGTLTTGTNGAHRHTMQVSTGVASGGGLRGYTDYTSSADTGTAGIASDGAHTHSVSGSTAATGSGTAHENRPPYLALAYIMRVA